MVFQKTIIELGSKEYQVTVHASADRQGVIVKYWVTGHCENTMLTGKKVSSYDRAIEDWKAKARMSLG